MQSQGVKINWLADKMGMKSVALDFLINESPKIDDDLYNQIIDYLESYELELELYDPEIDKNLDLFDSNLNIGIGERIRLFARKKYNTSKKLAEAMDISPQQLQQYISGNREPGSKILLKLLQLGCDINWLLSGSDKIESYKIFKLEKDLIQCKEKLNKISELLKPNNIL